MFYFVQKILSVVKQKTNFLSEQSNILNYNCSDELKKEIIQSSKNYKMIGNAYGIFEVVSPYIFMLTGRFWNLPVGPYTLFLSLLNELSNDEGILSASIFCTTFWAPSSIYGRILYHSRMIDCIKHHKLILKNL